MEVRFPEPGGEAERRFHPLELSCQRVGGGCPRTGRFRGPEIAEAWTVRGVKPLIAVFGGARFLGRRIVTVTDHGLVTS